MKRMVTKASILDACDALEIENPGNWTRDNLIAKLGGGSATTVAPVMKQWKLTQQLREVAPENPSKVIQGIIEAVSDRVREQNDVYESVLEELKEEIALGAKEYSEQVMQLEADKLELEQRVANRDERIAALELTKSELMKEMSESLQKNAAISEKADLLQEQVNKSEARLQDAEATSLLEREKQSNEHQAALDKLDEKRKDEVSVLSEQHKHELLGLSEGYKEELAKLITLHKSEMSEKEQSYENSLKTEKKELEQFYQGQERHWVNQLSVARDEIKHLKEELEVRRKSANETLTSQMDTLQQQIKELNEKQAQTEVILSEKQLPLEIEASTKRSRKKK